MTDLIADLQLYRVPACCARLRAPIPARSHLCVSVCIRGSFLMGLQPSPAEAVSYQSSERMTFDRNNPSLSSGLIRGSVKMRMHLIWRQFGRFTRCSGRVYPREGGGTSRTMRDVSSSRPAGISPRKARMEPQMHTNEGRPRSRATPDMSVRRLCEAGRYH